jgi:hypothetical protein
MTNKVTMIGESTTVTAIARVLVVPVTYSVQGLWGYALTQINNGIYQCKIVSSSTEYGVDVSGLSPDGKAKLVVSDLNYRLTRAYKDASPETPQRSRAFLVLA